MKSSFGGIPGNINMRGKRTKALSCRCCVLQDFRPLVLAKVHADEISAAFRGDREGLGPDISERPRD